MVLALRGAEKTWPDYVLADPNVRIKTGDAIYRAKAVRVEDVSLAQVAQAIGTKYPDYADRMTDAALADAWYFEIRFR